MVLWEITLGTAYFLGLKQTYKLALRIQRRVITPKYPRIRQFVQRLEVFFQRYNTAAKLSVLLPDWLQRQFVLFVHLFLAGATIAVVHLNIQQRDIEVGRNLGNGILRWLDQMKPSAQIRGPSPEKPTNDASSNTNVTNHVANTSHLKASGIGQTSRCQESCRHLITSARSTWSKPFPSIAMMMRPSRPAGIFSQYRHLSIQGPEISRPNYNIGGGCGSLQQASHWAAPNEALLREDALVARTSGRVGFLEMLALSLFLAASTSSRPPNQGQACMDLKEGSKLHRPGSITLVPQLRSNSQATRNDKAMEQTTATTGMELADRAVGFLLSLISISTFTYYTFWVIILPFVDSNHFVHQYFLPQEYAILVPVFAGVALLCFLCVFVGFVMLKSKKKKA
ncbi:hypothetical protein SADUNF_Sadunf01G0112300 [Salix dunnii]|uniref:Dolichol phosphate-mannose biosynthesis regulatory protein n=1 Tax=Salix dunnii TaxID=1413687 RepID=A0A835NBB0_9ROSI|nr:hypothetical protein SADUNF_Sadunf01G0112300 [Salix dunnii]